MDLDILLGPVANAAHAHKLAEIAAWLDQHMFPCTFSVVDGCGHFTVSPDADAAQDRSWAVFRASAADTVICALAARLNPLSQETP